jgi:hypothetical protein
MGKIDGQGGDEERALGDDEKFVGGELTTKLFKLQVG